MVTESVLTHTHEYIMCRFTLYILILTTPRSLKPGVELYKPSQKTHVKTYEYVNVPDVSFQMTSEGNGAKNRYFQLLLTIQ